MRQDTYYDELRDKDVCVGGLSVDLAEAIENGVISSVPVDLEFNGIESSDDVDCAVTDTFHALMYAKNRAIVMKREKEAAAAAKAAAPGNPGQGEEA